MTISANSRYANNTVVALNDGGQVVNVIVPSQPTTATFTYVSHVITSNDRLDNLANQYYGDPTQWWQIANANVDLPLIDWTNVEPGTIIRIPFT